ncbi:MAG TPA: hypothetical protein VHZ54_07210, partial [Solirubrobacterales bacterium]|nr:hypothetical protein [Solirubrobacterales bacterium]
PGPPGGAGVPPTPAATTGWVAPAVPVVPDGRPAPGIPPPNGAPVGGDLGAINAPPINAPPA